MFQNELSQLESSLLRQGYSRQYIRRLAAEIEDHCCCILEEQQTGEGNSMGPHTGDVHDRLGSSMEIVAAVCQRPELKPMARRFPVMMFVGLPSILLMAGTIILVWIAHLASHAHPTGSIWSSRQLADSITILNMLFPVLVVGAASLVAMRSRLTCWFPVLSALIMCLGALFKMDIGYCDVSHSIICYQSWGLDSVKLAMIVGTLVGCVGFAVRRNQKSESLST